MPKTITVSTLRFVLAMRLTEWLGAHNSHSRNNMPDYRQQCRAMLLQNYHRWASYDCNRLLPGLTCSVTPYGSSICYRPTTRTITTCQESTGATADCSYQTLAGENLYTTTGCCSGLICRSGLGRATCSPTPTPTFDVTTCQISPGTAEACPKALLTTGFLQL